MELKQVTFMGESSSQIVDTMSNDEYHSLDALGSTGLRLVLESPAKFYARSRDPNRPASKTTDNMLAGTLFHTLMLEPHLLDKQFVVMPEELDARTKAGKEWKAANKDRTIITEEMMSVAEGQKASVMRNPDIASLLEGGVNEQSIFWFDFETGVLCKCRPDKRKLAGGGQLVVDLKTTQDASPEGFAKSVANYGYHNQGEFYTDGIEFATGIPVIGFVFVAVESTYPYLCASYVLDDLARESARLKNRAALRRYAECNKTNQWPGYEQSIQPLSLPKWAL